MRDADGAPVAGAELAAVVVDEAVLALSNYKLASPVALFYSQRGAGARDHHNRGWLKLAQPESIVESPTTGERSFDDDDDIDGDAIQDRHDFEKSSPRRRAPGAMPPPSPSPSVVAQNKPKSSAQQQPAIAVRTNFNALAVFAPEVSTGADGRARVQVKIPDNLTRYRVMVVAVHRDKFFGSGESSITARMPLMVRPSPPRFLNFGDTFELPVVLQNQTDEPMTAQVAIRSVNAAITKAKGFSVHFVRTASLGTAATSLGTGGGLGISTTASSSMS